MKVDVEHPRFKTKELQLVSSFPGARPHLQLDGKALVKDADGQYPALDDDKERVRLALDVSPWASKASVRVGAQTVYLEAPMGTGQAAIAALPAGLMIVGGIPGLVFGGISLVINLVTFDMRQALSLRYLQVVGSTIMAFVIVVSGLGLRLLGMADGSKIDAAYMKKMAIAANASLPKNPADEVSFAGAEATAVSITYTFVLKNEGDGPIHRSWFDGQRVDRVKELCAHDEVVRVLRAGMEIAHRYKNRAGQTLDVLTFHSADCPPTPKEQAKSNKQL